MRTITVWQPWASLIQLGFKPYEFRSYPAPKSLIGQRIAIHAGKRPPRFAELHDLIMRLKGEDAWSTALRPEALPFLEAAHLAPSKLTLSHVVCTAVLGEPKQAHEIALEFGAEVNDSDRHMHANWGWPLTDIEAVIPPAPASGKQGFWEWTA